MGELPPNETGDGSSGAGSALCVPRLGLDARGWTVHSRSGESMNEYAEQENGPVSKYDSRVLP